jgi:hypothetical protein
LLRAVARAVARVQMAAVVARAVCFIMEVKRRNHQMELRFY